MRSYHKVKWGRGRPYHILRPGSRIGTLCSRHAREGAEISPLHVYSIDPLWSAPFSEQTYPADICERCLARWKKERSNE